jgi:hypothetical protein
VGRPIEGCVPLLLIAASSFRPARIGVCAGAILETTGRANVRCGGIAAGLPELAPNLLSRVGVKSTLPSILALANSFAETGTMAFPTGKEFTIVRCCTAVMPPGELRFA